MERRRRAESGKATSDQSRISHVLSGKGEVQQKDVTDKWGHF